MKSVESVVPISESRVTAASRARPAALPTAWHATLGLGGPLGSRLQKPHAKDAKGARENLAETLASSATFA